MVIVGQDGTLHDLLPPDVEAPTDEPKPEYFSLAWQRGVTLSQFVRFGTRNKFPSDSLTPYYAHLGPRHHFAHARINSLSSSDKHKGRYGPNHSVPCYFHQRSIEFGVYGPA